MDRLCDVICSLQKDTVKSITGRDWIMSTDKLVISTKYGIMMYQSLL